MSEAVLGELFGIIEDISGRARTLGHRERTALLEVCDRGSGLAPGIHGMLGTAGVSTKQEGMGLGLFLTFHTLRRFGGEAQLFDRDGGGTRCRVRLPLATLRISDGH